MDILWILVTIALVISGICAIRTVKRRLRKNDKIEAISLSGVEKRTKIVKSYSQTIKSHKAFLFFHIIKITLSLVIYFFFYHNIILLLLAAVLFVAVIKVLEDINYMRSVISGVGTKDSYGDRYAI